MKTLFLILLVAAPALAQPVSAGVKAGVPITGFFSSANGVSFNFSSNTKQYIAGLDLEVRLPFGLGIELDALYHPVSYTGHTEVVTEAVTANAFEFPLLVKYRLQTRVAKPFVDAGAAFSTLTGLTESLISPHGSSHTPGPTKSPFGFVMGGGVEIHLLAIPHFAGGPLHALGFNGLCGPRRRGARVPGPGGVPCGRDVLSACIAASPKMRRALTGHVRHGQPPWVPLSLAAKRRSAATKRCPNRSTQSDPRP